MIMACRAFKSILMLNFQIGFSIHICFHNVEGPGISAKEGVGIFSVCRFKSQPHLRHLVSESAEYVPSQGANIGIIVIFEVFFRELRTYEHRILPLRECQSFMMVPNCPLNHLYLLLRFRFSDLHFCNFSYSALKILTSPTTAAAPPVNQNKKIVKMVLSRQMFD